MALTGSSKENKRAIGGGYEKQAAEYLVAKGYLILESNYRCRMGEIDLIAMDSETLVFVEVKYRRNLAGGGPTAAVGYKKQRKISSVASYYLLTHFGSLERLCRFDVIGITPDSVEHIINAFDFTR